MVGSEDALGPSPCVFEFWKLLRFCGAPQPLVKDRIVVSGIRERSPVTAIHGRHVTQGQVAGDSGDDRIEIPLG